MIKTRIGIIVKTPPKDYCTSTTTNLNANKSAFTVRTTPINKKSMESSTFLPRVNHSANYGDMGVSTNMQDIGQNMGNKEREKSIGKTYFKDRYKGKDPQEEDKLENKATSSSIFRISKSKGKPISRHSHFSDSIIEKNQPKIMGYERKTMTPHERASFTQQVTLDENPPTLNPHSRIEPTPQAQI